MTNASTTLEILDTPLPRSTRCSGAKTFHYALLLSLLLLLTLLILYPLLVGTSAAFRDNNHFSLLWLATVLHDRTFLTQVATSFALACTVVLLSNLISFPLALLAQRYDFPGKKILAALVLVPMVLPPFVGAIGIKQFLGTFGSLTVLLQHLHLLSPHHGIDWLAHAGFWALAGLITLGVYPIAFLNLQASLANIDPAMREAAENLGGRRLTIFRRITLPLAMPGIFAGSAIVFIWAFTELGAPLILDYRQVASRGIWDDLTSVLNGQGATGYAKVVIVLLISVVAYLVGKFTFGRSGDAIAGKATLAATTLRLTGLRALLAAAPFLLVTGIAMLPHLGVILYSLTAIASETAHGWGPPGQFGWYRSVLPSRYTLAGYQAVFNTPEIYRPILNSAQYAGLATLLNLLLGVTIAWVITRTRIAGRAALDSLAMLPLAVPGLVMAFGFIAVLLRWRLGWILESSPIWILVIAYAVRRMPYLVRSAAGGLQQTSITLEEAAANLGASPLRVLVKITLPLILPNLIAGALLTFSFSMLEVSDSVILAKYPQHFPITKMIYMLATDTSGPDNVRNACALGVLAMGLLILAILSAGLVLGKRLGTLFRA